ncbi:MAG TPA: hypothetical protein VJB98_03175 [Candidatus Paceibacterota bacterium]
MKSILALLAIFALAAHAEAGVSVTITLPDVQLGEYRTCEGQEALFRDLFCEGGWKVYLARDVADVNSQSLMRSIFASTRDREGTLLVEILDRSYSSMNAAEAERRGVTRENYLELHLTTTARGGAQYADLFAYGTQGEVRFWGQGQYYSTNDSQNARIRAVQGIFENKICILQPMTVCGPVKDSRALRNHKKRLAREERKLEKKLAKDRRL